MTKPLSLILLLSSTVAGIAGAEIYCSTTTPKAIPPVGTGGFPCTGGPTTDTITVPVGDDVVIADVNVYMYVTHTFAADLDASLTSPSGTEINLTSDNGGNGDNYGSRCGNLDFGFDDAAPPVTTGVAPFLGSWQPEELLASFNGQNSAGTWTLDICDDSSADVGQLECWCVEILEPPMFSVAGGIEADFLIINNERFSAAALAEALGASSAKSEVDGKDGEAEKRKAAESQDAPLAAAEPTEVSETTGREESVPDARAKPTADPAALSSMLCGALDLRYVDRGEGTVLDCETGLIWLKDASCLGMGHWDDQRSRGSAQSKVDALNEGAGKRFACEGYEANYKDWRLPTMAELCGRWTGEACGDGSCCSAEAGLVDARFNEPAVANARGDGPWGDERAFAGVQAEPYWSSDALWAAHLSDGSISPMSMHALARVWPVRREPEKRTED